MMRMRHSSTFSSFFLSGKKIEGNVHAGDISVEVDDKEQYGAVPQLRMHILQISALAFLPAIAASAIVHRWVGFSILAFNFMTTEYSHRLIRGTDYDCVDILDLVAIGGWVLYNLAVIIQVSIFLADSFDNQRFILVFLACVAAIASGVFDVMKRRHTFRSKRRNFLHINMHLAGGLGTLLLLCATINLDVEAF
jgi:hypothetical protein